MTKKKPVVTKTKKKSTPKVVKEKSIIELDMEDSSYNEFFVEEYYTLILNDDDYEKVKEYSWVLEITDSYKKIFTNYKNETLLEVIGIDQYNYISFKNHNDLDYRKSNLTLATIK